MQRAMARQAEAERERRAKVISAEGEFQASERLKDAAAVMAQEPITVQLRYLQTLLEIGSANNSTIVFPIPIDLLTSLSKSEGQRQRGTAELLDEHVSRFTPRALRRRELAPLRDPRVRSKVSVGDSGARARLVSSRSATRSGLAVRNNSRPCR